MWFWLWFFHSHFIYLFIYFTIFLVFYVEIQIGTHLVSWFCRIFTWNDLSPFNFDKLIYLNLICSVIMLSQLFSYLWWRWWSQKQWVIDIMLFLYNFSWFRNLLLESIVHWSSLDFSSFASVSTGEAKNATSLFSFSITYIKCCSSLV